MIRCLNWYILCILLTLFIGCNKDDSTPIIEKIILDETDTTYGYYYSVKPRTTKINSILFLLPGFGQKSEDIFIDSKLHKWASINGILTIGFSGYTRMTSDSLLTKKIDQVLSDVLTTNKLTDPFITLGGYSAGGVIAMRYIQKCIENLKSHPTIPDALFLVDSPIDLYYSWNMAQQNIKNNYSDVAVAEAQNLAKYYRLYYGTTPSENPNRYITLSPFSMDTIISAHEKHLVQTPVRTYHDIDVSWRLINRNQSVRNSNYLVTSELINRLRLMGNSKAEFIQSFQTGYRRDGTRHPHSWSIVDEKECINWILNLVDNK